MFESVINIFGYSREVLSQRPPDEVLLAIGASTDQEKLRSITLFGSAGKRPIMSMINKNQFRLHYRIDYRNTFARDLHGIVEATANGCRIRYKLRMPRVVQLVMAGWLIAVAYGAYDSILASRIAMASTGVFDPIALMPIALFFLGLALMIMSQRKGSGNEVKMEEFIKRIAAGSEHPNDT